MMDVAAARMFLFLFCRLFRSLFVLVSPFTRGAWSAGVFSERAYCVFRRSVSLATAVTV